MIYMKKIFIHSHSCELRLIEATRIYNYFSKNDDLYKITHKPEDADVIIFSTCTFSNTLAEKLLAKAKEFQKYDAELILTGCLAETKKDELSKFFNGKILLPKDTNKIEEYFPSSKVKFEDIAIPNVPLEIIYGTRALYNRNPFIESIKNELSKSKLFVNTSKKIKMHLYNNIMDTTRFRSRFYTFEPFFIVRVSDGCIDKHPCSSFFGNKIKNAVGPLKSKPLKSCIDEFKKGLKEGYHNFVLNADDTGAYGLDINSNFAELLDEITKIPGEYNIEIENIKQRWIVEYIDKLEKIVKRKKISRLKILIESGSSRILKLMNRYSDTEKMKDAFLRLKKSDSNLSLFTHVVIGFPSETDDDFKSTINFIKEVGFDVGYIYTFPFDAKTDFDNYSERIGPEELSARLDYAKFFLKNLGYDVVVWCCFQGLLFKKDKK
jgi:tRNA A37 methylthiotransferase MiaB